MRSALLLTAYDRPQYLRRVLATWRQARGLDDWHVRFAVEPSDRQPEILTTIRDFIAAARLTDVEVVVNERRLGVARNPFEHITLLFAEQYDFVVRAEDDLLVSTDVLRLFEYTARSLAADASVSAVCAFSDESGAPDPGVLQRRADFCPWVWGTWRDRWTAVIGPTWDHDYSTYNDSPGFESGWDWNLNTRVLPARGLGTVRPAASRVQNIGTVGQHGTADNLVTAPSFAPEYGSVAYRLC